MGDQYPVILAVKSNTAEAVLVERRLCARTEIRTEHVVASHEHQLLVGGNPGQSLEALEIGGVERDRDDQLSDRFLRPDELDAALARVRIGGTDSHAADHDT